MVERALGEALKILANHQPRELDPHLEKEMDDYVAIVAKRSEEEYYAAEWEG